MTETGQDSFHTQESLYRLRTVPSLTWVRMLGPPTSASPWRTSRRSCRPAAGSRPCTTALGSRCPPPLSGICRTAGVGFGFRAVLIFSRHFSLTLNYNVIHPPMSQGFVTRFLCSSAILWTELHHCHCPENEYLATATPMKTRNKTLGLSRWSRCRFMLGNVSLKAAPSFSVFPGGPRRSPPNTRRHPRRRPSAQ